MAATPYKTGTGDTRYVSTFDGSVGTEGDPDICRVASQDGDDVALGAKADSAATNSTSSWSAIALLKGVYNRLAAIASSVAATLTVAQVMTAADAYVACIGANTTASSYPSATPKTTGGPEPADNDVTVAWSRRGTLVLVPHGVGANNATFSVRVLGWQTVATLEVPVLLAEMTCTLASSLPGVSGQAVDETNYFCDKVVVNQGLALAHAPDDGLTPVCVEVPVGPYASVGVQFKVGTATSCNALRSAY